MKNDEDIFKEIMALIDKRNRLCEEWIERIDREQYTKSPFSRLITADLL